MTSAALSIVLVVLVTAQLLISLAFAVVAGIYIWPRLRARRIRSEAPASVSVADSGAQPAQFTIASTGTVTLDVLQSSDLDALYEMEADPRRFRYELDEPPSREEVAKRLKRGLTATRLDRPGDYLFPAIRDNDGTFLGTLFLELTGEAADRTAEVGIALSRAAQRKGYALQALELMFDVAFGTFRLHRVVAQFDSRNIASARLCNQLGLRPEARFIRSKFVKGRWIDVEIYAVLAEEWEFKHLPAPSSVGAAASSGADIDGRPQDQTHSSQRS